MYELCTGISTQYCWFCSDADRIQILLGGTRLMSMAVMSNRAKQRAADDAASALIELQPSLQASSTSYTLDGRTAVAMTR